MTTQPDMEGHFGRYGGRYVAETLMPVLVEVERAYGEAREDPAFRDELRALLRDYVGRPSPLYFARRLAEAFGGARIYLKREDLNHTGAHKVNNTVGQALLARRMGKTRLMAETGGDIDAACDLSELSHSRLYGLMKKHGVSRKG